MHSIEIQNILLKLKKIFAWSCTKLHSTKCKGISLALIIKKTARQYIHIELQNDVEKLLFILSKNTELLTSFFHQHLENFSEHIRKKKIIREKFSFKNIKPKSVLGFFVLIAFQFQYVIAQPLNALPTNGKVVAGAATISQTSAATNATMTVNQTSQRAVINWDSFNVGKNAAVNFVTPGANSSTLNRVTGASPSLIQGALSSNGQIILVNANGITFGRGAQVDAPGVVASTMDIANKDFMDGKSTFSGSGSGKIVNKGTISATTQDGFIALLAPEVQNQGYLLASKGGTVVMTAGEQITLNFQGKHLGGVNVDIATYKALVANKRVVEVNGGLVVMAAGAANQLMSSVIKNTGRVSASSVVNNGGEIEFVGNTVTQAGTVEANSTTGVGGQVNLVGNNITATSKSKTTATGATGGGQVNMGLAQTAVSGGTQVNAVTPSANTAAINQAIVKANATQAAQNNSLAQTVTVEQGASIDASATQSGNGGIIAIWSALKTNIAGSLKAIGGAVSGNGGFVETSSKGTVILAPNAIINTSASNGKAGTWLLDPIDLTIDAATANIISAALENNNVSIAVNGNVCPSLGSCTQNGSGSLTIASGTNILKATGSLSTLSLSSSGVFNLNANISGQNLNVIISSSIAYLNTGSSITANQVTVQAQSIYANGIINAQSGTTLGAAIQLLAQAIYVSGGLNTSTSSNTNTSNTTNTSVTYNGNIIRKEDLPTFLTSKNNPNGNIASGLDVVYTSSPANDSSASAQTNTNQTNIIHLNAVNDLTIYSSAQILANGTNSGQITLSAQQLNAQSGSLIQANGNNGPGGVIAISGNQFNLDGTIAANGNDGGLISINAGSGALSLTGTVQANGSNGRGGTVIATQASDIQVNSATIQANGKTDGGVITLIADTGSINFTSALIQTNGSNGRGGSIGISAQNNVTLSSTKVDAIGLNQGGTIKIGNDASNGTLPFALHTSLDANSAISANQLDPSSGNRNGGFIETSAQTVSLLAAINAGRGGIWLIDPVDLTINSAFASLIVTGLQNSDVIVSTTANACAGVSCSGSGTSGNIFITNSITTNTNNSLYIEASGAIVVSSGVNIWLNTSNNSSYTASTGTGSLFMGGVSVGSITSSNWNTSCTGCYANAVQGGAGGSNYSGINLGTSGAGSAAVNIQVGGDVVMAGQNATTSNGYAGITLYSGSKVYGRNVSLYGISSAGVGMQLSWGDVTLVDLRATSSTGTLLLAGSSSKVDTGAAGYGVFLTGSSLRAPTLQIIGVNTNASCITNTACAGISLGWYTSNTQLTNIYTSNLKLVSDKVVLGLSPVQVAFCDSGCGGGIGTSLGIDFSSYGASSAITFYYPGSGSSTTSVAAGNNYGNYLVLPTAPNFSSYRYSVGGAITVGANLSVNGPISITASTLYLGANLTVTDSTSLITLRVNAGGILYQQTTQPTLTAPGGITINADGFNWLGGTVQDPRFDTSGVVTIAPTSSSFSSQLQFQWFVFNVNHVMTGLNIGKSGNTTAVFLDSAVTVNGPINVYSNATTLSGSLTTTNGSTGNILIQDTVSTDAGLTGSGAITLAGGAGLTINQLGNSTYGGAISGALSTFTKSGGGTLTLTGANTYTGSTSISAGTVNLSGTLASTAIGISGNGTLAITGGGYNRLAFTSVITINNGTLSNTQTGTGGIGQTMASGSVLNLNGNATVSLAGVGDTWGSISVQGLTINSTGSGNSITGGALAIYNTGLTINVASASLTIASIMENSNSTLGLYTKTGAGTLILTGANTYTGVTTISAGTIQVGDGGTTGNLGTGGVVNNSALVYNRSNAITDNNIISGNGTVTQAGTGTVTLGGANTYIGVTTVNAGILTNAASTSTKTSGFVINNGGTYKISSTGGFPNNPTNGYTFVVNSGGTLDLNGVGWLDGGSTGYAIQLNGGTLANNSATAATVTMSYSPTRDIVLTNNSIIGGSGNITINGVISGAYSLTNSNTGVVTLGGANSYSGGTFIGPSSKIVVTNANALGGSSGGVVNIGSSGILDLQYAGTITLSSLVMATGSSISNTTTNSALTVSGTSTLLGTVTTSGAQTYTGAVLVGGTTTLNSTTGGVTFSSSVASSATITEVIQFLGGGSYNFAGTAGTATGTATTFADGSSISYNSSTGVYTFVAGQSASTQYLVVGGGGGASRGIGNIYFGAGAGGGAVASGATSLVAGTSYSVTVGGAGIGQSKGTPPATYISATQDPAATSTAASGYNGGNGGTSSFASISAAGGLGSIANGAMGSASGNGNAGGRGTAYGITTTGCAAPGNCGAGGGGGAGGAGTASAAGVGIASAITGSSVTYGAGGCASNGTSCASGTLTTNIGAGAGDTGSAQSQSGSAGVVILSIPNVITTTSLTINAGTGAVSMIGNVTNINLAINSKSTSSSIAGVISGPASLTYNNGSGYTTIATPVLTLSNANTYSGGTTIIAGTVRAGNASAFGSGSATVGSVATSTATVDLAGYSIGNAMTLNGGGSTGAVINSSTTSPSTVSGAVTIGSAASLGGAGNLTFSNTVTDSGNGIAFVGTGNFTMNNAANAIGLIGTVSASAIGNLSITDNTALTIGSVSVNAVAYAGINSSGTVSISANSGSTSTAITSSQAITANSLSLTGTATTAATAVSLTGNLKINTGNLSITGNDSAAGSNIGINQTGTITDNSNGGNITFTSNNIINQTGAISLVANTASTAVSVTYNTTSGNKSSTITTGALTVAAGTNSSAINYIVKSAGSAINPGTIGSSTVALPGYVLIDNTYGCTGTNCTPVTGFINTTTNNLASLATTSIGITLNNVNLCHQ
ncbi:hypothetical protein DP175_07730, partial [Polynucleobacter paneuropaeus]